MVAARLVGLSELPGPAAPRDDFPFVELAARSGFSLLDGASNPEALAERAAELGAPSLALADEFDLGGIVRFARACEESGVHPVFGATVRVAMYTSRRRPGSPRASAGAPVRRRREDTATCPRW